MCFEMCVFVCVCRPSTFRLRRDRYSAVLEADDVAMCGNCRAEIRNTSDGLLEGFLRFAVIGSQD